MANQYYIALSTYCTFLLILLTIININNMFDVPEISGLGSLDGYPTTRVPAYGRRRTNTSFDNKTFSLQNLQMVQCNFTMHSANMQQYNEFRKKYPFHKHLFKFERKTNYRGKCKTCKIPNITVAEFGFTDLFQTQSGLLLMNVAIILRAEGNSTFGSYVGAGLMFRVTAKGKAIFNVKNSSVEMSVLHFL